MKNIYCFLVFVLTLLINLYNLNSQDLRCSNIEPPGNECYAPWRSIVFDVPYECNGVVYNARITFCFYCDITANLMCFKVLLAENLPADCSPDEYFDEQIVNWLFALDERGYPHISKFCGNYPCGAIPIQKYHLKVPMCVDIIYNRDKPGKFSMVPSNNCERFCYWEIEACWCNCTPDCDPSPNCVPHMFWRIPLPPWSIGFGNCEPTNISYSRFFEQASWVIRCNKRSTPCDENGFTITFP